MKLDYPIMVAALGVAAAVQEVLPAIPVGEPALKAQFVPAVALYYLRHRQWQLSLTAAMWAGVLLDALGSLPFGTSSFALFFIGIVTIIFRRHVVNQGNVGTGCIDDLGAALFQALHHIPGDTVGTDDHRLSCVNFVKRIDAADAGSLQPGNL